MSQENNINELNKYFSLISQKIMAKNGRMVIKFGDLSDVQSDIAPKDIVEGKVLLTGTDTVRDFIGAKTAAGEGIQFQVLNQGGNEVLQISTTGGTGIPELEPTEATGVTYGLVGKYYVANNVSQVLINLPETASFGDKIGVCGKGAGGWKIQANSGQYIHIGMDSTKDGGFVQSLDYMAGMVLMCITTNTNWAIIWSVGNFEVEVT